ncbi:MAG: glycosyltransferase family 2 protein [bacterium]|nr:glycosyltransferase family 2 protein [bacterium]
MPAVSVVIPTYNRIPLLKRAVNSVLSQTLKDIEIIVIDDASSVDIASALQELSHDIIYIRHTTNKGASAARNTGIRRASAAYIAFLDSDDEWLPEKLVIQYETFQRSSEQLGMVYTDFCDPNDSRPQLSSFNHEHLEQEIFIQNIIGTTSTPMVRRSCFDKVGVFDEALPSCQDWDMWIRLCQHYESKFIPIVLVHYFCQDDSISKDNKATLLGHKILTTRYRANLTSLSPKQRATHYIYLGKLFYWRRALGDSMFFFARACHCYHQSIYNILDFLIVKNSKKILAKFNQEEKT